MTKRCRRESEKLQQFLLSKYCEDVTTEIMLHTWITLNDAEDIWDCLLLMLREDTGNNNYSEEVQAKLKKLSCRIDREAK